MCVLCKASMWLGLGNNTYKWFNVDGTLKFELETKGTGGGDKVTRSSSPSMLFSWASSLNLKDRVGSCLHLESMLTSTSQCLNLKDMWTRVAFIARLIDANKHFHQILVGHELENTVLLKKYEHMVYVKIGDNIYVYYISSSLWIHGQISLFFSCKCTWMLHPLGKCSW